MTDLVPLVLWVSLAAIAYAYIGYAGLLTICSRLFGRDEQPPLVDEAELPFVSVVIAAYNEESVIKDRVSNLMALDYPADRFEIVVASDGSSDRTCEIVRSFRDPRLRLCEHRERRGKASVLNDAFQSVNGEIVVLSDANTMMDARALRNLARWFKDPSVGVVSGRLILTDPATGANVDSLYWKYETFLKQRESRLGALLGANGAIYAIRRSVFTGIRPHTAVDDLVIPLLAKIASGCRLVYDSAALAFEETPPAIGTEFRRRSRIGAGGYQSLTMLLPLLNPVRGWIAFTFWSHKVLRWTCPFFMLGALGANAVLALDGGSYAALLLAQLGGYGASVLGHWLPGRQGYMVRFARLTALFASMNVALLVGFFMWATGRQAGIWQRTVR